MSPTRKKDDDIVEEPLAGAAEAIPDDALPGHRWPESAYSLLGVSPEIVKNALEPERLYTRDQVESAIQGFMSRQVS